MMIEGGWKKNLTPLLFTLARHNLAILTRITNPLITVDARIDYREGRYRISSAVRQVVEQSWWFLLL